MRYIGSKIEILPYIERMINKHVKDECSIFLDLFGGTNVVGNYFKNRFTVYSNDLLYFSYVNARATIGSNGNLKFEKLNNIGISYPLDFLQNEADRYASSNDVGYYEKSYSPTGGAMYLTVENAKRIDYIRDTIDYWFENDFITDDEFYYLLSCLLDAIPNVSNTTGTYGAYLKHWDNRALKKLELKPITVKNNYRNNKCFNMDANELVKFVSADVVYIDTPYNSRQYASNYHLLENIASNDKPVLKGKTKIFDWYNKKSKYSSKMTALIAMEELISNVNATHLIISYNNEGIICEQDLLNMLKRFSYNGNIDVVKIPYKKYKSKIPSKKDDLYEILIYIQKKKCRKIKSNNSSLETNSWEIEKKKYIKSPLNYIGGKYKLLSQIIPLFPKNINIFVDAFSGGANVGINVEANSYIFNDMNKRVNEMFRFFLGKNPDEVINLIKKRIKTNNLSKTNKEAYLEFRRKYNENPNPLDLYVLSSYSYNYQIRFNNSMEFNNPFGKDRSCFSKNMENNLKLFINRLNEIEVEFTDLYFDEIDIEMLGENDFVYLDPPYLITTGNYNDGNRGFKNWNEKEEIKMYNFMRKLNKKGIKYALSNVIVHKGKTNILLKEFIDKENVFVSVLNYNYKNSSHNTKRIGSVEVLITNYDPNNYK